ncbi:hypothetical protein E2I00_007664 [Balaenoptera physalus]|uniref:Dipeptidyl peptidase 3 n=1 Tax=Balaenoptera physalus TaxID=9770 RepID=A0A6A1QJ06_BALPH|nr:hypothetical protein E2I00_007664 [Balaenoptera physalus]
MADTQYILPNDIGVSSLDCREAFRLLLPTERLYAHHLSRAAWYGGLAVLLQTSPEAPYIYALLSRLFRAQDPDQLRQHALAEGLTEEEYQAFLVYTAGVYSNMGNYKSFGDTKFVPNLPKAAEQHPEEVRGLWQTCGELMFSLESRLRHLGLGKESWRGTVEAAERKWRKPEAGEGGWEGIHQLPQPNSATPISHLPLPRQGITTYFSGNCTMEDAKLAQDFLDSQGQPGLNEDVPVCALMEPPLPHRGLKGLVTASGQEDTEPQPHSDISLSVECDLPPVPRAVALDHMAHDSLEEKSKLHLSEGLMEKPILDSEMNSKLKSYEFQGSNFRVTRGDYAPILRKVVEHLEKAKAYAATSHQEQMLTQVWSVQLPKAREISLGGERKAPAAREGLDLSPEIQAQGQGRGQEGEERPGLLVHPLGHLQLGSGDTESKSSCDFGHVPPHLACSVTLRAGDEKGAFNFDQETVINPETGEQIQSWYRSGETWDSKFSTIASSYEECRAESVGLYLCLNPQASSWRQVGARGPLRREEPEVATKIRILGAHMQARFVILRVLLEAGEGLVTVTPTTGSDGRPDAQVHLDRNKIRTVGKPALERFLRRLQVLKSTGDVAGGRALYEGYAAVTDAPPECFLSLRDTVLLRKEARKLIVQPNTRLKGSEVQLLEYEASAAGLIRSFSERFPEDGPELEEILTQLATADARFWKCPSETPSGQA